MMFTFDSTGGSLGVSKYWTDWHEKSLKVKTKEYETMKKNSLLGQKKIYAHIAHGNVRA